jgi:chemotaxis methyl-accepting protein methylase
LNQGKHESKKVVTNFVKNGVPEERFVLLSENSKVSYYQDRLKKPAFNKVINQLSVNGFLIIGSHERLPSERTGLLPYGSLSYVFKKRR